MRAKRTFQGELADLRGLLAWLTLDAKLIRLERHLARKDWSDQPRAPAGQPEGGQWIPGGGGASREDPVTTGSIDTEDGSRVLSIRIHAQPRPFDEQHFVTAPDGESRIFETSGDTQTVRDGETGEVLGRSTFTAQGAEPEARVQSARSSALATAAAAVAKRTVEAAIALFGALSRQNDRHGTAALGLTATEFSTSGAPNFDTTWVGRLNRQELDAACPSFGMIQALADEAAAEVKSQIDGLSPQEFGNRVHMLIAKRVKDLNNPNLKAELSLYRDGSPDAFYGRLDTIRLDVLERVNQETVCVYDHKTGRTGLSIRRTAELAEIVYRNFGEVVRIIVVQIVPLIRATP